MNWFDELYSNMEKGKIHAAMDILYEKIDDLFIEEKFCKVDEILTRLDLERLDANLLAGVLTITLPAKDSLKKHAELFDRIAAILRKRLPDRAEAILRGLE